MRFKKFLVAALAVMIAWCGMGIEPAQAAYNMPYYIEVDLTNQMVTVFNTKDGSVARQMLCSTGLADHTPTGTWYMPRKERDDERTEWYYMPNQYTWVKYATKIYYAYFFHSFLFAKDDDRTLNMQSVEDFGVPASHGCIRLRIEDAKYIAENCLAGTRVKIYKSNKTNDELRKLLYISSFSQDEGITYQEFLGISKDALSYGAKGEEVQELQMRLRDLGYYGSDVDGMYDTDTLAAVKTLQQDLGIAQSGITSPELKEVIFSDEAPVSAGSVTIGEGSSGPVVKQFQEALKRLGVYQGDIDSVYDADVVAAVKDLQRLCGYEADGVATSEIQHLAYYEVKRLETALGADFTGERVTEEINMGKMIFQKSKIIVRSKPDTDSSEVAKLGYGDQVVILATKDKWAQVIAKGKTGFMYSKYLEPFTKENYVLKYEGNGEEVTVGQTLEQMMAGESSNEQAEFRKYFATYKYMDYLDDPVEYATINTGDAGVALNMRAEASSEGEILAKIPNGAKLRVLAKTDEWTRVGYDDQIGYLMNQYLDFSEGTASDVVDTTNALAEDTGENQVYRAVVMPNRRDGTVYIFEKANSDSKVIGSLGGGREVWVDAIDEEKGWAHIKYGDKIGYMQSKNLSLRLDTSYTLDENGQLSENTDNAA